MRKTWLRSLQGLALVASVAVLTGAKGNGCGGGDTSGSGGSEEPPILICPDGQHGESICDGHGNDCDSAGCHDACVPNCDDGNEPIYVCPDAPPCPDGAVCNGPNIPLCGYTCQPSNPCGQGFHPEEICEGSTGTGTVTPVDDGGNTVDPGGPNQPYPGSCVTECVPDDVCPPGFIEETVCAGSGTGTGAGGGVFNPGDGNSGGPDQSCWVECVDESSTSTITVTSTSWSTSSWSSSTGEGGWQPF